MTTHGRRKNYQLAALAALLLAANGLSTLWIDGYSFERGFAAGVCLGVLMLSLFMTPVKQWMSRLDGRVTVIGGIGRNRAYWLCQIIGWGTYSLLGLAITASFRHLSSSLVASFVLSGFMGLLFTHYYRSYVRRKQWVRQSMGRLTIKIVIASVSIAVLIVAINSFTFLFIVRVMTWEQFSIGSAAVFIFNWSVMVILWSLIYFGLHFFQNYKQSEIEKLKLEASLKDAELTALKSQMNPHFLFNALNSIRALTVQSPPKAQEAVTRLAGILRYALQANGTQTVTLEQELQTVEDYLALETIRLEERLTIERNIDPQTLKIHVPMMLIQTLVENAIKHGIAQLKEGGTVSVHTAFSTSGVEIEITNSGRLHPQNGNGVGLTNVRQRLHLLYGSDAILELREAQPDTVIARVVIPKEIKK